MAKKENISFNRPYVICRTQLAGVFAGYLCSREGNIVELKDARRIWYWDGAASISEMAVRGVAHPEKCKIPCPVERIVIFDVVEILFTTEKAQKCIEGIPEWTAFS